MEKLSQYLIVKKLEELQKEFDLTKKMVEQIKRSAVDKIDNAELKEQKRVNAEQLIELRNVRLELKSIKRTIKNTLERGK